MKLWIPKTNDKPSDFDKLFNLWNKVITSCDKEKEIEFDFTSCDFLKPNAVAFLAGLAKLSEHKGLKVTFNWDSLLERVKANLAQNGFLRSFGYPMGPYSGNSIQLRIDVIKEKNDIVKYLRDLWLGRNWIHMSGALQNKIVGRMWEIYENAFQHASSEIGIFSCGQHFPNMKTLKMTMIDFGVGIPHNVRQFLNNDRILSDEALEWAFRKGTSSKPYNGGRGLGLDYLKELVGINKGALEIYSHNGYAKMDESANYSNRTSFFKGTIINITLQCDEKYYMMAEEADDQPLF